ncbi:MAG: VanZ family protein [Phycisphaerales bacterium]
MIVSRAARRIAFWAYAVALFVLTHKPKFTVPGPPRIDLVAHAAAFGLWTILLIAAGFFGPPLSIRNITIVAPVAVVYAAIDEALQAIPWVRRHAAWDDWAMDCVGIALALVAALLARQFLAPQQSVRTQTAETRP